MKLKSLSIIVIVLALMQVSCSNFLTEPPGESNTRVQTRGEMYAEIYVLQFYEGLEGLKLIEFYSNNSTWQIGYFETLSEWTVSEPSKQTVAIILLWEMENAKLYYNIKNNNGIKLYEGNVFGNGTELLDLNYEETYDIEFNIKHLE